MSGREIQDIDNLFLYINDVETYLASFQGFKTSTPTADVIVSRGDFKVGTLKVKI